MTARLRPELVEIIMGDEHQEVWCAVVDRGRGTLACEGLRILLERQPETDEVYPWFWCAVTSDGRVMEGSAQTVYQAVLEADVRARGEEG